MSSSDDRAGSGPVDGGQMDGGQADGGRMDGGQADGGQADGGQADGGRAGSGAPDVLVLGEVLVELTSLQPLANGATLRLGFSGDALNAAAAAAAAGARTALLARVPQDDLGDRLVERVAELGVDTSLLIRTPGQHGLYLQHADPHGARDFVYARRGSAGSSLCADDVPLDLVAAAGAVLASGIACAISASAFGAVRAAAAASRCFVYDPNWRPLLAGAAEAAEHLRAVAPHARLVTPAWPREARALLDPEPATAEEAALAIRQLGAAAVALTQGPDGVLLAGSDSPATSGGFHTSGGSGLRHVPAFAVDEVVDQTGAGDVLAGTVAARLALGDDLLTAVRLGAAAAALSLRGHGGTGYLPPIHRTRELAGAPS